MPCRSFHRLLDRLMGKAGPGLGGVGEHRAGRDAEALGLGGVESSVEIIGVPGGGPLRLRDRFSRHRFAGNIEKPAIIPGDAACDGGVADRPHVVE